MKTALSAASPPSLKKLQAENDELRARLQEAEETIEAIRSGAVDALVVTEPTGDRIYTLEGAERPYRLFVEEMEQGAATLHTDGTIAWCNRRLALMLSTTSETLVGTALREFVSPQHHEVYDNLLRQGRTRSGRAEAQLRRRDGAPVPAFITFNALPEDCGSAIGVLVTDLTPQRHHEQLTAAHKQLRRNHDTFFNLIENAPFGVYVVDAEFRLKQASAAAQKVFSGVSPLLGRDFAEVLRVIWPEPFVSEALGRFRHTLETGEPYIARNTTEKRQDIAEVESYDWRIERVTLPDGQFGVVCYFYDITERIRSEADRARLAAIVDSSEDAIISKTLEGIVTSWNAGAERLLGYRAEEMIGRSISTIVPPELQDEEAELLKRLRREERIEHFETVRMTKDGRRIEVSLGISPLRDGTGRVRGASKIMRDITERRQAERALKAAQANLEEHARELERRVAERTADLQATNEQLEAFVYSIAHDLRAPLRSMQGFSAALLKDAGVSLSEPSRGYATRIDRSAQFMDALLLDLLTFCRLSQGRVELSPVHLEAVVQKVRSHLEQEIQEKQATVEMVGPWPQVLAHEPTLGQVVGNLLSNALKFSRTGVPPQVRVRAEEKGPWVRVWVEDNGIGIEPDHQEQVFRLFMRLHGDKFPGTGIGLAIVQKGTERMSGQVGLESTAGQGSRFWVELRNAQGGG